MFHDLETVNYGKMAPRAPQSERSKNKKVCFWSLGTQMTNFQGGVSKSTRCPKNLSVYELNYYLVVNGHFLGHHVCFCSLAPGTPFYCLSSLF